MRVLIVANHNKGFFVPFIVEQVNALKQLGIEVEYFGVHGKGIRGYLSNRSSLIAKIREYHPDLIHAHYGLSGLLANLQRKVPVVTTYHGSDIHEGGRNLLFSRLSIWLSAYNIFVTEQLQQQAATQGKNQCAIPCGIDTKAIFPMERSKARELLGWNLNEKYVLFAGAFDNDVKNSPLAKAAVALVPDAHLMEMRGYTREQVNWAMNAANCLLMTSHREGSPQVVKEALTCGTPIVSVDVGDVKEVTDGIDGCYVTSYDAQKIADNLQLAFAFQGKTKGPKRIVEKSLSNELVAKQIIEIYQKVIEQLK
jgi:glycosyltransferase involved in cell wall biosynthesis